MLLFCDNAGADVMGMLLLARALVRVGGDDCVAVLVANSTPGTIRSARVHEHPPETETSDGVRNDASCP